LNLDRPCSRGDQHGGSVIARRPHCESAESRHEQDASRLVGIDPLDVEVRPGLEELFSDLAAIVDDGDVVRTQRISRQALRIFRGVRHDEATIGEIGTGDESLRWIEQRGVGVEGELIEHEVARRSVVSRGAGGEKARSVG